MNNIKTELSAIKISLKVRGNRKYPDGKKTIEFYEFHPNWITNGADDDMIEFVDKLGNLLKNEGISSSQLRNVYGEIMRIKMKGFQELETDFVLLKPKIVYNGARLKNEEQKAFFEKVFIEKAFNPAYKEVKDEKTFDNFQKFFEAILAYHKFHGGK